VPVDPNPIRRADPSRQFSANLPIYHNATLSDERLGAAAGGNAGKSDEAIQTHRKTIGNDRQKETIVKDSQRSATIDKTQNRGTQPS
jgi:hypothetical protein